jgi:hypothetical protein
LKDDDGGRMRGLRAALLDTTAASAYCDVQQNADLQQTPPDPQTIQAPNIVGMPRTELAQQITMARAMALVERVKGRAPARQAFLGEGAYFQRPWARAATRTERLALDGIQGEPKAKDVAGFAPDGTPIVFAADAPAGQQPLEFDPHRYYKKYYGPQPENDQWNLIKDALVTQRQDKDTIYEGTLAAQQKLAGDVHNAERDLSKTGDKSKALLAIRKQRAALNTLHDSIKAVNGNSNNVDCKFLQLHDAATLEDYGGVPNPNSHAREKGSHDGSDPTPAETTDDARRRWFGLLGFPALQHLFLLSVDAELSFRRDEFATLVGQASTTPDFVLPNNNAVFLLIRVSVAADNFLPDVESSGQPWTLGKSPKFPCEKSDCFMPATLEELLECFLEGDKPTSAQDLRQRGTIDQFDGVLDLEAAAVFIDSDPTKSNSSLRFSIETVDIHAAAESDMRRDAAMASATDLRMDDGTRLPAIPEFTAGTAVERKLRTAGLQLLDQWRGSVVVKQFSRSLLLGQNSETLVLDADDLAVGWRLDVGFRTGEKSGLTWACLNNREVTYSLPGHAYPINKAVDAVLGVSGAQARKIRSELDGSVLAMPTRLLQNADRSKTGFAESVLATWQGDPLGLQAHKQQVGVCPGGLALNVDYNLLSDEHDERPPKLRFGVPYWLGARTVFLGGVCLPLADAKKRYTDGLDGGMLLPRKQELRRFLRHEWIDPPMVAVPWGDILSELQVVTKPVPGNSEKQFCRGLDGEMMVVRTPTPLPSPNERQDHWRFQPLQTHRAVCAPGVDFTFAHLHGVFDKVDDPTKKSGLAGVDYDPSRGGFPSISPQAPIEEESIVFAQTDCNQPVASGIAIFRARNEKFTRPTRAEGLYYPDPAARSLVIGLRFPWTTDTYLTGAPIVVPVYGGGNSGCSPREYPDALPVLITVEAVELGKDGRLTSYQQLEKRAGGKPVRLVPIDKRKPATGHNVAFEVTIKLAPAEDFCVDVWALPDIGQLAQWFDAPESLAFACAATKYNENPDPAQEKQKLVKAMPGKIPDNQYHLPLRMIRRNDAVVTSAAVARAAAALHAALSLKPVPELSAVRSLRAVHAVEQPPLAPKLLAANAKPPEIRFLRVDETKRSNIVGPPACDWHNWERTDDSTAATDVLAGGDVYIDRAIHESVELRVRAVSPNGRPLDNPLLGRTPEDRSRGLWPERPPKNPREQEAKAARHRPSPTRRLYGFDVDAEGCVTFSPEEIVFNKWPLQPKCELAQETASLVDLTAESEQPVQVTTPQQCAAPTPPRTPAPAALQGNGQNPAPAAGQSTSENTGNGRRSAQRYFSDGTARRVKAYFAATSRTARLIPERWTYPDAAQQENDKKRLFAIEGGYDNPVMTPAIIRSIMRPLALPPKHILPAFAWTRHLDAYTGARRISRRTRIRIPFDRPAMTSGEDERIGIVLWPPNILGASTKTGTANPLPTWTEADLACGTIRRAEPLETGEPQNKLMDLQALAKSNGAEWRPGYFSDEDLGPGGAYISRWGADPIHDAGEMTWFMHPRAFRDLPDWTVTALDSIAAERQDTGVLWPEDKEERYKPRLVENVLMPIPGDDPSKSDTTAGGDAGNNGTGGEAKPKEPDFMLVSLLTYAPRFDVESETWYVDVEIDPGTAPDPFLRLGLVRFQPHANRRIQVSYPVAEWIQVVGYCRDVTIERHDECVTVKVKGPVLAKNTSEAPLTIIRGSLIERRTTEYGVTYERPAREVTNGKLGEPIEQVSYANAQSDDLICGMTFQLPANDPSDDAVEYAIFIEEYYRMRRATFDEEPVTEEPPATERDDPAYWRNSGPRFAVRLDL